MAPIACIIDYPIVGSDATSSTTLSRNRSIRDGIIIKRQRLTLKQLPKIADSIRTPVSKLLTRSICEADTPSHPMLPEANLPDDSITPRSLVINHRKELMDIVVRTLALVRRNYMLQLRLNSLRLEAKNFFQSVLNNSENNNYQSNNNSNVIISTIDNDNINEKQILSYSNDTTGHIIHQCSSSKNQESSSHCITSSNS